MATAITGGPYLPLAGGTMSGNLILNDNVELRLGTSSDFKAGHTGSYTYMYNYTGHMYLRNFADNSDIIFQTDDGSGGYESYFTLDGSTGHAYFSNYGNVGIGTTAPTARLEVKVDNATIYDATSDSGQDDSTATVLVSNDNTTTNTFSQIAFHNKGSNRGISRIVSIGVDTASTDLAFVTENINTKAEKMRITSDGNVGIGKTDPSAPLHISGGSTNQVVKIQSTTSPYVRFKEGGTDVGFIQFGTDAYISNQKDGTLNFRTNNTDKMTILSGGNVGIGTTSPSYKLQVGNAGALADSIRIGSYDAVKNTRQYIGYTRQDTGLFETSASGNTPSSVLAGVSGIRIVNTEGSVLSTKADQSIQLLTHIYNGGSRVALHANYDGNVGIGTTSPSHTLDVNGELRVGTVVPQTSADFSVRRNGANIEFGHGNRTSGYYGTIGVQGNNGMPYIALSADCESSVNTFTTRGFKGNVITTDGAGSLMFSQLTTANATGQSLTERMRINNAGNVGIGTTSPDGVLHIKKDNAPATFEIQGGLNTQTTAGAINGEINFGVNDPSTTGGIGASIKNISQISNGAHNGLAFFTGLQSRTPYLQQMLYFTAQGGLSFGTTNTDYGTSGQILKSNADAPPSWVNASTVIGGPYLPLAGGTMSGGLNIEVSTSNTQLKLKRTTSATGEFNIYTNTDSLFFHNVGQSTYPMMINSSGNVGIGTTSPNRNLHVIGQIALDNAATSPSAGMLITADGTSNKIYSRTANNNSTPLAFEIISGSSSSLYITSGGNVGIGTTSPADKLHVAVSSGNYQIDGDSSGNIYHKSQSGEHRFRAGGGTTNAFNIANSLISTLKTAYFSSNVGIGTTGPQDKLHVVGTIRGDLKLEGGYTSGTTDVGKLTFGYTPRGGDTNNKNIAYITAFNTTTDSTSGGYLTIGTRATNGSTGEHIRVTADGNVGIGTTAPTHKLHVNGNMRLTGALRDSNNAPGSAGQVLSSTGSATDWIPLPATPTIYTPKVYNLNNSTNINSQGQKLVPDFGTLEIEGNTTIQQVSNSDTDFQVTDENTGIYEVTYAVFYKNTGNQRTPLGTYLTLNGTAVNGSLMVNYVRSNVTGGGNFSSCTNTFYVNVTDASHPMALCVRRADSSTAPSGFSMVEPAGMAVKSTISFRRIS